MAVQNPFAERHLLKERLAQPHLTQQRWEEAHKVMGREEQESPYCHGN